MHSEVGGAEGGKPPKTLHVGILTADVSTRPDLLQLAESLALHTKVTILTTEAIDTPFGVELRRLPIDDSIRTRLIKSVYLYLGRKPIPSRHLRRYEIRRLDKSQQRSFARLLSYIKLGLRFGLPPVVGYGRVLQQLRPSSLHLASVSDVDVVLAPSDISDDSTLAAAVQSDVPVLYYVYSWDHPPKFHKIPTGPKVVIATWSSALADDIRTFHPSTHSQQIELLPATQFAELLEPDRPAVLRKRNKVLFAASFGYPTLAEQEVDVFIRFARQLKLRCPMVELTFRGYPHLRDSSAYAPLSNLADVKLDLTGTEAELLNLQALECKTAALRESLCVVHMGTTVGLEAALLGVPSLYVNVTTEAEAKLPPSRRLSTAWQQYHLMKYFAGEEMSETIMTIADLVERVIELHTDSSADRRYSRPELNELTNGAPMAEVTQRALDLLRRTAALQTS